MRFSLMFFAADENALSGNRYDLLTIAARFADTRGFHALWVPERHFATLGSLYPNPAVLQAALARETSRLALRAGSVVLPLRDPVTVVEDWAMVDNLSGGRVGISLAPGWNPDDFAIRPENYASRYELLHEGIQTVRHLWRGGKISRKTGNGDARDLRVYPTPVQRELPVWVTAAGKPSSFEAAGRLGANLLTHLLDHDAEELAEKIALYHRARREAGHPGSGEVSVMLHTFVGHDAQTIQDEARRPYCEYLKSNMGQLRGLAASRGRTFDPAALSQSELDEFVGALYERFCGTRALIGDVDGCARLVERLRDAGVTEIAALLDFGPSPEAILRQLPALDELRARFSEVESGKAEQDLHLDVAAAMGRCVGEVTGDAFYRLLAAHGASYGAPFRRLTRLRVGLDEAVGELELRDGDGAAADATRVSSAILDNANLVLAALTTRGALLLPVGVGRLDFVRPLSGQKAFSHVTLLSEDKEHVVGDVRIYDEAGFLCVRVLGQRLQLVDDAGSLEQIDSLLYRDEWAPAKIQEAGSLHGPVVIVTDEAGDAPSVAKALEAALTAAGWLVRSIALGSSDGDAPELRHKLAQGVAGFPFPANVVLVPAAVAEEEGARVGRRCAGTLAVIQALLGVWQKARIWVATEWDSLAHAAHVGLMRVLSAEHPERSGGIIEIVGQADEVNAALRAVPTLLSAQGRASHYRWREGAWQEHKVVRARERARAGGRLELHRDAEYVITGGTGDLGLRTAEYLASEGAGHITLLSRAGALDEGDVALGQKRRLVTAIERRGARVEIVSLDLSDERAVERFAAARRHRVRGVFHTAGVADGALLLNLTGEQVERVFAGKVLGAIALDRCFPELDYFVSFSAVPALIGWIGVGAANYSAANCVLDRLAEERRGRGQHAVSIGWGPWRGIGMAARQAGGLDQLARQGIGSYSATESFALFPHLVTSGATYTAVANVDWARFFEAFPGAQASPQLSRLVDESSATLGQGGASAPSAALRARVSRAPENARTEIIADYLAERVAAVMATSSERLDVERSLTSLGMDSLMSLELRNRVERELGIAIPMVDLLRGPSVRELASSLASRCIPTPANEDMEEMTL